MREIQSLGFDPVRDVAASRQTTLDRATQRFEDVLRNTVTGPGETDTTASLLPPEAADSPAAAAEAGRFSAGAAGQVGDVAELGHTVSTAVTGRLKQTAASEQDSQEAMRTLLTGGNIQLHNVILAAERAKLELQLTMQLRNKLIEAYQEVMRTPV